MARTARTPCAPRPTTSVRPAKPDTLPRVLEYWKNVDADTGKQIEELVQAGLPDDKPTPGPIERRGVLEETSRPHAG